MSRIVPVILSGGSGTRLWPLSRELYPKQLQPLYSERSMLQETALRVAADGFSAPLIICNNEHRFIIAEQLQEQQIEATRIVLEPMGRNTAPAAAVAAMLLTHDDPDAMMLLMPSDHLIAKPNAFYDACKTALPAASGGALVTFGVTPQGPETGYGYIMRGAAHAQAPGVFTVSQFVEKPDLQTAERYVASGDYFWNSGIFLFSARHYLEELEKRQPETISACRRAVDLGVADLDFFRLDHDAFAQATSDSIDYAVMEHADNAVVVPVDMGWNDVGTWSSLWEVSEKDASGNVVQGDVLSLDVRNSYLRGADGLMVAALGVEDVIIIATPDAVLVASKDRVQDVKAIVTTLKEQGRSEHNEHTRVHRPWGWYQRIDSGEGFQAKQLMVKPGGVLSLQRHAQRAEHWVVVSGQAEVTQDESTFILEANHSTYVAPGVKHRLVNRGDVPLRIIEVQSGSYLGEDDIERFEDVYGRALK